MTLFYVLFLCFFPIFSIDVNQPLHQIRSILGCGSQIGLSDDILESLNKLENYHDHILSNTNGDREFRDQILDIISIEYSEHHKIDNESFPLDVLKSIRDNLRLKTIHQYRMTAIEYQLIWINVYLTELKNMRSLVDEELAQMLL